MAGIVNTSHPQSLDETVNAIRQDIEFLGLILVQHKVWHRNQGITRRRSVQRRGAREEPFKLKRVVSLINERVAVLRYPVDLAAGLVPKLANLCLGGVLGGVAVTGQRLRGRIKRDRCRLFLAEAFDQGVFIHVHPAPYGGDFLPGPRHRVAEVLPMDIVGRSALVFDLLWNLFVWICRHILTALGVSVLYFFSVVLWGFRVVRVVSVFGKLQAVLG